LDALTPKFPFLALAVITWATLFKMTTKYDGKIGREQHHFSNTEKLPL